MDLKWCNGALCLHLIDPITRFIVADVIHTKKKEEVIDQGCSLFYDLLLHGQLVQKIN